MNIRLGGVAVTDVKTWRQDLWDKNWTVQRFSPFGLRLLLWLRNAGPIGQRELLRCALIGHDKKRTRHVRARLEIPGAAPFTAAICFRCGHIYEDESAAPVEYQPCAPCEGDATWPEELPS